MQTVNPNPDIVIVGGGAGGLELATKLGKKLGKKGIANITLIDKHRVHIWKPLLHEVATGSLDTEIDGVVYRAHAKSHHYQFQLGEVTAINRQARSLRLDAMTDETGKQILPERHIRYDLLVLAIGSISNDFATPGVTEHCHLLDSKLQAQGFQQKLLNLFLTKSQSRQQDGGIEPTRLAIVGGGATGVELSAELYHVIELLGIYDVKNGGRQRLAIDLIEAGPRILPALPERIADAAVQELERLGVTVHTGTKITCADECGFIDAGGNRIDADLLVWAAGVKVQSWLSETGLQVNQINQVVCDRTLKSISDDSIYVIGDCCAVEMKDGAKVPPRAQAAHQMASTVARNLINRVKHRAPAEFKYKDYGSLVNLARFSTVGSLMGNLVRGSMFIEGRIARLMYLSLYRMHQLTVHGLVRGPFVIMLSRISKIIRPKIKLH